MKIRKLLAFALAAALSLAPIAFADDLNSTGSWSETDAGNSASPPNGWPAGMLPSQVEPTARSNMGAVKRFWDRINPATSTTGSAGAYVYTTSNVSFPTSYSQGEVFCAKANFAALGNDTFQVNSLAADPIYEQSLVGPTKIVAGQIQSGQMFCVAYDAVLNSSAGGFQLISALAAAVSGPTTSVSGDLPDFNGTGGNLLGDSGVPAANFPITGTTAGDFVSFNNTTGKLQDSGVQALTASTSGDAAAFGNAAGGLKDAGFLVQGPIVGEVYFKYVSATQVEVCPFNGNLIRIAGAIYATPSGCITAANTIVLVNGSLGNLAANTPYYVSLFNNSGTLTLEFWALASFSHMPDTTAGNIGTEVISSGGSPTTSQSLVGMISTNGSSQFYVGGGVISWFNRQRLAVSNAFNSSTTSTTPIALSTTNTVITWKSEAVGVTGMGYVEDIGSAADLYATYIYIDGSNQGETAANVAASTVQNIGFARTLSGVSEGPHAYAVEGATTSGNNGQWVETFDIVTKG